MYLCTWYGLFEKPYTNSRNRVRTVPGLETRVINTLVTRIRIRVFRAVKNNMAQVGLCASMLWLQTTQRNRDWVL